MLRHIFFISDGTGITAELIGQAMLTQFDGIEFVQERIPFINNEEKAEAAAQKICDTFQRTGTRPIVVNTLVDQHLTDIISNTKALILDVFKAFLNDLEKEFDVPRSPGVGRAHGIVDAHAYQQRIEATHYALDHDDGITPNFDDADIIIVGVSRSGKTPTCLYMALNYSIRAANYPLTEDDFEAGGLPAVLKPYRDKLYGLTIDPFRLHQIREARRAGSRYSSLRQCEKEVNDAAFLFRQLKIPNLSTTKTSVEEISSHIMMDLEIIKEHC